MSTTSIAAESTERSTEDHAVPTDAESVAAGLRQLADFLDANPDLPGTRYAFHSINLFPPDRAGVMAWARAAMRSTGKVDKFVRHQWAGVVVKFGPVSVDVTIERDEICERVVVDTREVTKEVPDPDAVAALPLVTVTEVEEIVEWRCGPLMATPTPDSDPPQHYCRCGVAVRLVAGVWRDGAGTGSCFDGAPAHVGQLLGVAQ